MEDGGYYAIKGFDFQIDKTILALFDESAKSEQVAIEQIQDLNTDDIVVQVKYKETQEFANSKIREPVVKLIEAFVADPSRQKYVLYCYFKDKAPDILALSAGGIDDILKIELGKNPSDAHKQKYETIQKIDKTTREEFAKRFVLQFAESYDSQFSKVIEIIERQDFCKTKPEAIFFYAYIADYLRKIVVNTTDASKRICDRKNLVAEITDGKRAIFYSSFEEFTTRAKFIQFVKGRVPTLWINQKNCVVFGAGYSGTAAELAQGVHDFLRQYYKNAQYNLEPPLVVVPDAICKEVKANLIEFGFVLNDGFEEIKFKPDFLVRPAIVTRKLVGKAASDSLGSIAFMVRIVSFSNISLVAALWAPTRLMYFGALEVEAWKHVPAFLLRTLHPNEMPHLVKVGK